MTARLWAYVFPQKLADNTTHYVSRQFYEHKPKSMIYGAIKVHKTHKYLGYLESEDALPLVWEEVWNAKVKGFFPQVLKDHKPPSLSGS